MEFFNIGPMELLLVLVVALLVFGPKRLPEIAGKLGKAINEFKAAQRSLTNEFAREFKEDEARRNAPQSATAVDEAAAGGSAPGTMGSTGTTARATEGNGETVATSTAAATDAQAVSSEVSEGGESEGTSGGAAESSSGDAGKDRAQATESDLFDWEAEPSQRQ